MTKPYKVFDSEEALYEQRVYDKSPLSDEHKAFILAHPKQGIAALAERLGINKYKIYRFRKSIGQATLRQRLTAA